VEGATQTLLPAKIASTRDRCLHARAAAIWINFPLRGSGGDAGVAQAFKYCMIVSISSIPWER